MRLQWNKHSGKNSLPDAYVEDATPSWLLNIGGRGDGDFGHLNRIPKYDLSLNQINLIKNAENISTAKLGTQFTPPRDLSEKVLWNSVVNSPSSGKILSGLNNDPRFPTSAGFQKIEVSHKLPDNTNITIHYQYNSYTKKAYDIKIVTPKRSDLQPGPSFKDQ